MVLALGLLAMTVASMPLFWLMAKPPGHPPGRRRGGRSTGALGKEPVAPVPAQPWMDTGAAAHDSSESPLIPKVIHHSYKLDLNDTSRPFPSITFALSWRAWRRHFPEGEFRYQFWSDDDNRRCIEEHFPQYLEDWLAMPDRPEKFDTARYCYLYAHGGVYQDLDYEPLRCFYDELEAGYVSLIGSPYSEGSLPPADKAQRGFEVQNALMASPKRHPFWLLVFWWIFVQGKGKSHAWNAPYGSGPRMLGSAANQYPDVPVMELPANVFQPVTQSLSRYQKWARWLQHVGILRSEEYAGIHWGSWSYDDKYAINKASPVDDLTLWASVHSWCPGVTPVSRWDMCGDPRS